MDIKRIVIDVLSQVARDKGMMPVAWTDAMPLGRGGADLDRLDMATAVAELDSELGVEPFASSKPEPSTVADLVALYEQALTVGV